uniref:Uncharacterized protein n=1 Tax=Haptolina brevifila TaxID=156173 RepID=A0A7S2G3J4_9EUKA|mmetsp:Transcript_27001/g.54302  ORF Transcript_27001/g.54302 Transcript_27001/m.54302 type:complete len:236 (+) Transcript_27001:44-751(+)
MKMADGNSFLDPSWMVRKTYKWYLFSDTLMVCVRNKLRDGYRTKLMVPLDELEIRKGRFTSRSFTPASSAYSSRAEQKYLSILKPSASLPTRGSQEHRQREQLARGTSKGDDAECTSKGDDVGGTSQGDVVEDVGSVERAQSGVEGWVSSERLSGGEREASISLSKSEDKPEVFFIRWHRVRGKEGTLYKCWAADEASGATIVAKVLTLQKERVHAQERSQRMQNNMSGDPAAAG